MVILSSNDSILISKPDTCDFDIRVNPSLLDFNLYTQTSNSLILTGNGLITSKLEGYVKISSNPDNSISIDETGLLVLPPATTAGTDEFVKASSSDTTSGTLASKLAAGAGISLTKINAGANEHWVIANTYTSLDSVTTSGTSGAASFISGVLNIPIYDLVGLGGVPTSRSITINGTGFDLSVDRTWSVGTVTSITATAGTGISITGSPITTSGTINITNTAPDQTVVLTAGTGISITGTYPNFTIVNSSTSSGGTVTSVAALTLGTTGTDLSSSVATGTTTPVITLNVPTASASNRGALSAADWTIFNGKQDTLTFNSGLTNTANTVTLGGTLLANANINAAGFQVGILGSTTVTLGNNNIPLRSTSYLTATGSEAVQLATTGVYGGLHVDIASGTFTPYSTSKHGAISGTVYKTSAGIFSGVLPAIVGCVELSGTGDITTIAAIRAFRPELTEFTTYTGVVTNAVGIYIDDISASSIASTFTNKYSIMQIGTSDINLFNGKLNMPNLPIYADNTAASSLPTGQFYRTATGTVMIKY